MGGSPAIRPQRPLYEEYHLVGRDVYSCVAPPGYEKDPAIIAAIHEFDPGAIPIWRIQRWRMAATYRLVNVVHHGIGRYYPFPRYMRRPFHVTMPSVCGHPVPNFLDVIFEDQSTLQYKRGGPGDYVPWDWAVYQWCRAQYMKLSVENWLRLHGIRMAREDKRAAELQADFDDRMKDFDKWVQKKIEGLTERDVEAYVRTIWGKRTSPERRALRDYMNAKRKQYHIVRSPRTERTYGQVAPAQGVSDAGS